MAGIQGLDDDDYLDRTEPLDTFQQDFSRRIESVRELGTSVYRECWDEFYRWEPGECQQLISDLLPNLSDSRTDFVDVLSSNSVTSEQNLTMDVDPPISEQVVTITIFDGDGLSSEAQIMFEEVTVTAALAPHPTYESCPPTSKNIARRLDELNEHHQTPFIPYADEQGFNAIEYAADCESFTWQVDWKDPDCKPPPFTIPLMLHWLKQCSGGHSA
jgi:histone-lysine N-methyltransferase EZH2